MAYKSFEPWVIDAAAGEARGDVAAIEDDRFSNVEIQVVTLAARSDVTREVAKSSRLGRLLKWATGAETDRSLASPRLESLRRFASLLRHHPDQLTEEDVGAFLAAGFTASQVRRIQVVFDPGANRTHLTI